MPNCQLPTPASLSSNGDDGIIAVVLPNPNYPAVLASAIA